MRKAIQLLIDEKDYCIQDVVRQRCMLEPISKEYITDVTQMKDSVFGTSIQRRGVGNK